MHAGEARSLVRLVEGRFSGGTAQAAVEEARWRIAAPAWAEGHHLALRHAEELPARIHAEVARS
jgi:hypothetical protein